MEYTILIPYHSNKNILYNCLSSILSTTPSNVKVIVLANNRDKNELNISYNDYRVFIQKYNFDSSYPEIMNLGVELVKTEGVIFCDADTFMEKGWYESLTSLLESDQSIGLVGANILNMNLGRVSDFGLVFDGYSWAHPYKNLPFNHKLIKTQDFQAICSACCAMKKETFIKIGKYDYKLRYTYCDIDLSLRMKKNGYRVVGCAEALVYHLGQSTQKNNSVLKSDNKTRLTFNNASYLKVCMDQYYIYSFKQFNCDKDVNYIFINLSSVNDINWYMDLINNYLKLKIISTYNFFRSNRDEEKIELMRIFPTDLYNSPLGLLFFVDSFISLKENILWNKLRKTNKDIVIDRHANILYFDEITRL